MHESAAPAPPKSASAPPADKPPAKKGGFSRWAIRWLAVYPLLLAFAAGGVLYAAYQQPKLRPYLQPHWHNFAARVPLLRRTVPAPAPPEIADTAEIAETAAPPETTPETVPATATEIVAAADSPAIPSAAPADSFAAAETAGDSFAAASADSDFRRRDEQFAAQIARMRDEITRLRDEIARTRNAVHTRNRAAPDAETRLELIDLRLRLDGDSAAAAAALSSLQNAPELDSQWLAAEIARLKNTASRGQIADTLQKMIRLSAHDSAAAENADAAKNAAPSAADSYGDKAAAALKRIFNVERIAAAASAGPVRRLRRMETLLLTGRRAAYLSELAEFAARPPPADADIAPLTRALQEFGAPIYALARPETR